MLKKDSFLVLRMVPNDVKQRNSKDNKQHPDHSEIANQQ